jgi:hypothetical protein
MTLLERFSVVDCREQYDEIRRAIAIAQAVDEAQNWPHGQSEAIVRVLDRADELLKGGGDDKS